jgi:hypothetical protein
MAAQWPVTSESYMVTECLALSSAFAVAEPMYPAPPVTKTFIKPPNRNKRVKHASLYLVLICVRIQLTTGRIKSSI